MFKPNYRIRLYIGRNLMAHAVVIADEDDTFVSVETRGGEAVKIATADLCLLMAQAVMPDGAERNLIEGLLATRGHGVPVEHRSDSHGASEAQSVVEDDIPF